MAFEMNGFEIHLVCTLHNRILQVEVQTLKDVQDVWYEGGTIQDAVDGLSGSGFACPEFTVDEEDSEEEAARKEAMQELCMQSWKVLIIPKDELSSYSR